MKWNVENQIDDHIIIAVVTGEVTLEGINELLAELLEMSKLIGVNRYLVDFRGVSLGISVSDVHQMPKTLLERGLPKSHKVALIYSDNSPQVHHFTFFDTMCLTSPLDIKAFIDYDEASRWLVTSA
jgi:hypothetical protein